MKYIKTPHWKNKTKQQGLLFFAQILNEALFDYTLDSYKPQSLNIRLLCIEAIQTIDHINSGLIKKPNIDSILEELIWSLNSDSAAKELVGNKVQGILDRLSLYKTNFKQLKEAVLLLYHFLDNRKYLTHIQNTLIALIPDNKEKERIYKLTRSYITELINYGYNPSFIYFNVNRFFFNYSIKFHLTDPSTFFEIFNFQEKEFDVVYKVSKLFVEFFNVSEKLGFKINAEYTAKFNIKEEDQLFLNSKADDELFVVFEKVKSLDENTARINTEKTLFKVGNLFSFYHHKEVPSISELALVINLQDNSGRLLSEPIKSIIKKADVKPNVAAIKVKNIFNDLNLPPTTIQRISRAIDLHSIALTSEQIENKLLNLWTAIETLVPKDIDCGDDRIVQLIKALSPFQELKYINKLIEQAGSDFVNFDIKNSKKIIKTVILRQRENSFFSLAALIMTKENANLRNQVYSLLDTYPLLRFRLFSLNKSLSNGKQIKKLLENHKSKVQWQIRRIYRVRNLIVHSGKMPSYTNILVENLHNYFDDFLNYIIDCATKEKRVKTITQAIMDAEIECENLRKSIEVLTNTEINLDNYSSVL